MNAATSTISPLAPTFFEPGRSDITNGTDAGTIVIYKPIGDRQAVEMSPIRCLLPNVVVLAAANEARWCYSSQKRINLPKGGDHRCPVQLTCEAAPQMHHSSQLSILINRHPSPGNNTKGSNRLVLRSSRDLELLSYLPSKK